MDLLNNQSFLQNLAKKAQEDATFKSNLLENPVKSIETFLGQRIILPQGKTIAIEQTDSSTFSIKLIAAPDTEDVELDEEQLDIVAGGGDGLIKG